MVGMCPHCGEDVDIDSDSLTAYHDWPKPLRVICPGSKQHWRNAESDARPLWNGKSNTRFVRGCYSVLAESESSEAERVSLCAMANGHVLGCAYDMRVRGHTIRYVPERRPERGPGLTVPRCICPPDVCADRECPDHGNRVFNRITGWHDEPSIGKDGYR